MVPVAAISESSEQIASHDTRLSEQLYDVRVMRRMGRALALVVALLLGAVAGAWLSLAVAYLVLEPAERTASGALFTAGWLIL